MDNSTIAKSILEAIDIVSSGLMDKLNYDKTIKCLIVDDVKAAEGVYTVTEDNVTTFTAVSSDKTYKKDMWVYVTIPQGDTKNQKVIIGRYVSNDDGGVRKVSDECLDFTSNLIKTTINTISIRANSGTDKKLIWSCSNISYQQFNRLILKGDFETEIKDAIVGTYGLMLMVTAEDEKGVSNNYIFNLSSENMYGNPYNYETNYTQEIFFNIEQISNITKMELYLVQNKDFKDVNNNYIPVADKDDIRVSNPYIALGYDIAGIKEETAMLYTLDPTTYDPADKANKTRTLQFRWVHFLNDGSVKVIDNEDEVPSGSTVHWYEWDFENEDIDRLAGKCWREIEDLENKFSYTFTPDPTYPLEKFLVIVETGKEIIESFVGGTGLVDVSFPVDEGEQVPATIVYKSDVVSFTNVNNTEVNAAFDLISALQISPDKTGYNGKYLIYSDSGLILNEAEATTQRSLIASYNSLVTGESSLDGGEKIVWYFPTSGSMIEPPQDGIEYDGTDAYGNEITKEEKKFLNLPDGGNYVKIERAIPNTVINQPTPGGEYDPDDPEKDGSAEPEADSDPPTETTPSEGENASRQTQQFFRIKSYYTQTATNNTIYCILYKNKAKYAASTTLTFGVAGTNGTDITFVLEMHKIVTETDDEGHTKDVIKEPISALTIGDRVAVVPKIYDYNNKDITENYKNQIKYFWYSRNSANKVTYKEDGINAIVSVPKGEDIAHCRYSILAGFISQAKVGTSDLSSDKDNTRAVNLQTFLPIPVRISENYKQVTGPNKIVYDDGGTHPTYYKENFKMNPSSTDLSWEAKSAEIDSKSPLPAQKDIATIFKFYPSVTDKGKLTPTNLFLLNDSQDTQGRTTTSKGFAVDCKKGSTIVWTQPILIIKNRYSSPMLNNWDGSFQLDEENGTIMSTMVGAGVKNDNNTFSGVLMGNVAAGANIESIENGGTHSGLGLYGFHQSEQSFGFNCDGTAFIGKSGRGRIYFNGSNAHIKGGTYDPGVSGMLIDLNGNEETGAKSASLFAYGPGGSFELSTNSNTPLLKLKSSAGKDLLYIGATGTKQGYYIQSDGYSESPKTGMRIDLTNGTLKAYDTSSAGSGDYIQISGSKSPFLKIVNQNSNLMYAGENTFYLQSPEYGDGTAKKGMRINLKSGTLISYNVTGNGDYVKLSGGTNSESFFKVHHNGANLMSVGSEGFYIQSDGYEMNKSLIISEVATEIKKGIKINLKTGYFYAYDIEGTGSHVMLGGGAEDSAFFKIAAIIENKINATTTKREKVNLIYAKENDFYIQSANYKNNKNGMRIDLTDGMLKTYAAENNVISCVQISGGKDSNGNDKPFFKIDTGTTTLMYASTSAFYLQSPNYSKSGNTGMNINLKSGEIDAKTAFIGKWSINTSKMASVYGPYRLVIANYDNKDGNSRFLYCMKREGNKNAEIDETNDGNEYTYMFRVDREGDLSAANSITSRGNITTKTFDAGNERSVYPENEYSHPFHITQNGYVQAWQVRAYEFIKASDIRLKNSINPLNSFDKMFMQLNPISFKYNKDGNSAQIHFGFVADEIENVFNNSGFGIKNFAGFTQKTDEKEWNEKDFKYLSYMEFIAWNTHMIQKAHKEINILKQENQKLQETVNRLLDKLT